MAHAVYRRNASRGIWILVLERTAGFPNVAYARYRLYASAWGQELTK
jgi:hypothetical protein